MFRVWVKLLLLLLLLVVMVVVGVAVVVVTVTGVSFPSLHSQVALGGTRAEVVAVVVVAVTLS